MSERKIVLNRIQTPDGTVLTSRFVHDYVTYIDKNGEQYMVDGGLEYLRRNMNKIKATELSVYDDSPFEIIREGYEWGTYGKDGKKPLEFVKMSEMSDLHIIALCVTTYITESTRQLLMHEMQYREENNIIIKD